MSAAVEVAGLVTAPVNAAYNLPLVSMISAGKSLDRLSVAGAVNARYVVQEIGEGNPPGVVHAPLGHGSPSEMNSACSVKTDSPSTGARNGMNRWCVVGSTTSAPKWLLPSTTLMLTPDERALRFFVGSMAKVFCRYW